MLRTKLASIAFTAILLSTAAFAGNSSPNFTTYTDANNNVNGMLVDGLE